MLFLGASPFLEAPLALTCQYLRAPEILYSETNTMKKGELSSASHCLAAHVSSENIYRAREISHIKHRSHGLI